MLYALRNGIKLTMNQKKKIKISNLVPQETIASKIFLLRGKKIMLDRDLGKLYGVKTKVLNQAVKRKIKRFPEDFMFKLTKEETTELVTNCDRFVSLKHSSINPRAFTHEGVAMLSSVLNSERAIMVNIQIMRTFTKLREMLDSYKDTNRKIESMERKYDGKLK